jgi:hypothetical protein
MSAFTAQRSASLSYDQHERVLTGRVGFEPTRLLIENQAALIQTCLTPLVFKNADGGIRTRHCLVSKTSASYRWATSADERVSMNLARFERATSSSANLRSGSAELQVQKNVGGGCGIRTRKGQQGPTVFGTVAIPVRRTLREEKLKSLAGALGFEPRAAILETAVLAVYTMLLIFVWKSACGRTRTYEVRRGRLIYSQVLLLLGHTCKTKFVMLKNR